MKRTLVLYDSITEAENDYTLSTDSKVCIMLPDETYAMYKVVDRNKTIEMSIPIANGLGLQRIPSATDLKLNTAFEAIVKVQDSLEELTEKIKEEVTSSITSYIDTQISDLSEDVADVYATKSEVKDIGKR